MTSDDGSFKIYGSVRQGCVMSSWLISLFMDKEIKNGSKTGNSLVKACMYDVMDGAENSGCYF